MPTFTKHGFSFRSYCHENNGFEGFYVMPKGVRTGLGTYGTITPSSDGSYIISLPNRHMEARKNLAMAVRYVLGHLDKDFPLNHADYVRYSKSGPIISWRGLVGRICRVETNGHVWIECNGQDYGPMSQAFLTRV